MSFPRKWESPTHPGTTKKRDARLHPGAQVREHDNEKVLVTQERTRRHNNSCHSCLEQESPTQPGTTKKRDAHLHPGAQVREHGMKLLLLRPYRAVLCFCLLLLPIFRPDGAANFSKHER